MAGAWGCRDRVSIALQRRGAFCGENRRRRGVAATASAPCAVDRGRLDLGAGAAPERNHAKAQARNRFAATDAGVRCRRVRIVTAGMLRRGADSSEAVDENAVDVELCDAIAGHAVGHGEASPDHGFAVGLQRDRADEVVCLRRERGIDAAIRVQPREVAAAVPADRGEIPARSRRQRVALRPGASRFSSATRARTSGVTHTVSPSWASRQTKPALHDAGP